MGTQKFSHCLPQDKETLQQYFQRNTFFNNIGILYKDGFKKYFHQDLPFDFFQSIKTRTFDVIKQVFKDQVVSQFLQFGSTSVRGIPGFAYPDFAFQIKNFPPSKQLIKEMYSRGYFCFGYFAGQKQDIGISKPYSSQGGIQFAIMIHVLKQGSGKIQKLALSVEQLKKPQNLQKYKQIKLQKMRAATSQNIKQFMDYKMSKHELVLGWTK